MTSLYWDQIGEKFPLAIIVVEWNQKVTTAAQFGLFTKITL